jgi:hypothetical protein
LKEIIRALKDGACAISRLPFASAGELLTRGRAKNALSHCATFIDFKIDMSFNGRKYMLPSNRRHETRRPMRIIFY